jgi:hypothetical protein
MHLRKTPLARVAVVCLLALYCACDSTDNGDEGNLLDDMVGTWSLVTVNEIAIPGNIPHLEDQEDGVATFRVEWGTLTFNRGGTWTFSLRADDRTDLFSGDFSVSGGTLSISWTGVDSEQMLYEELIVRGFTLTLGQRSQDEVNLLWTLRGDLWFTFQFEKG